MLRYAASQTCTCWNRPGAVSFPGRKVMYIGVAHLRWKKVSLLVGWLTDSVSEDIFCRLSCLPCAFLG
jgi:hypothetical protein